MRKLLAQFTDGLSDAGNAAYGGTAPTGTDLDPAVVVGNVINALLGILGVVFLILVIYAGILWMTAAGNEKQVEKAKDILINGVVGLVIILAAYTITYFVIENLQRVTGT